MIIRLCLPSQGLVTYGHHLPVTIYLRVAPSPDRHTFWNNFKLILKQNIKKLWERRSHAFPPQYTPDPI